VSNAGLRAVYTPKAGFLGKDRFPYIATDGSGVSTASVTVAVCFRSPTNLWLTFDDPGGTTVYDVGGKQVGTMTNFADAAAARVAGRFNRAIDFDGTDDHVVIGQGYVPPSYASDRTTAAWIRTTGLGAIIAWGKNRDYNKWHMRLESETGRFVPTGALRVETGGGSVRGTRDLRDGKWHHVAAVFANDGTPDVEDVLLYVDGAAEAIDEVRPKRIFTDVAPVTVGRDSQNRHLPGTIDEVRIYHRALSPAEIAALAGATHDSADAWHRRHFGEASVDWDADDDLDAMSRLAEYAFGATPHFADRRPPGLSIARRTDGVLDVRALLRRAGTHELTYSLLTSPDLAVWEEMGIVPVLSPLGLDREAAHYAVPPLGAREYLRLRAAFAP